MEEKLELIKQTLEDIFNNCPTEELEILATKFTHLIREIHNYKEGISNQLKEQALQSFNYEESIESLKKEFSSLNWEVSSYLSGGWLIFKGNSDTSFLQITIYHTIHRDWSLEIALLESEIAEKSDLSTLEEVIKVIKNKLTPLYKEISQLNLG